MHADNNKSVIILLKSAPRQRAAPASNLFGPPAHAFKIGAPKTGAAAEFLNTKNLLCFIRLCFTTVLKQQKLGGGCGE